ncbi:MAG TPA: HD domain-containing protein, partial [Acidimicrobiales bacterium]|nr:HD domain-containing protein [Acidimicrobiales bacterium]
MATVDRVLPWRRPSPIPDDLDPVLTAYWRRHERADPGLIVKAYEMAAAAHEGQARQSGEAYIHHPLAVALIVAELGTDEIGIAAALLHDAVEDTGLTLADVEAACGAHVAAVVDGVTKLDRLRFDSKEAQQAASFRKMIVAMAKDLRVLLIKLADRLHNMRTIAAMPEFKQRRTAQETLDVYSALAHRLGIQDIKWQLEDLAFAVLHPKPYAEIEQMVATRAPERDIYLAQVLEHVRDRLTELNI